MRQFAWYSPELDVIVIQDLSNYPNHANYTLGFEWYWEDILATVPNPDPEIDPFYEYLWLPLGEV